MFEHQSKQTKVHPLDDVRRNHLTIDGDGNKLTIHPLDQPGSINLHQQLLGHFIREMDVQAENRMQMHIDEEFYDGHQWSPADQAALEERGQKPIVYNVIAPTIDWITGSERRARSDFKILPRRKEDAKPATKKTDIIKYLSDVNRTQFDVSRAFEDAVVAGVGWMEDGIVRDPANEPIYSRAESWRNVLFDSAASEADLSDARYICRAKWVDLDYAAAMFPDRIEVLERSVETSDNVAAMFSVYGDDAMDSAERAMVFPVASTARELIAAQRKRLRLIEVWYRTPMKIEAVSGGQFNGEILDLNSPGHREPIDARKAEIKERLDMVMHVAIMTPEGMIWHGKSPYRHNKFPLTPIWGYRRKSNGQPYGMVRRLKDIQDDVNKRASKALYILSTNKILVEEGAASDMDELVQEAQRPDGVMVVKPGKMGAIANNIERDLPQYHLELMSRSIAMIQSASGVTDELLGRRTNAQSGIAIQRRQDQGTLATSGLFDNLRFAQQVRGEKLLSIIEQYMVEEKQFRITNQRGNPNYVTVNDGLPENDIVRSKADFIITEADWKASMRQASVDELVEVMGKLAPAAPQLVFVMLDLIVESMDIPNREELVRRIRSLTNQPDPDADEPTPEMLAAQKAQAEAAAFQQEMAKANLAALMAKADRDAAAAAKTKADMVGSNVNAQERALAAAGTALAMPGAIDIADHILDQSGFTPKTAQPFPQPPPGLPAPVQQQQPQPEAPPVDPTGQGMPPQAPAPQ